ncbi:HIRAN domain-containing protein [Alkalibacillus almallahensis]|uniref:HIRAN domain-containing protein n=1 Tax=Alkalibacillus almallahensis TaxID=1379154 RepID=UPI001421F255|nr:HIRAN domain-containing protein [Alkalibacillus almallahensis]NIK12444.1 hypothetical protein [Alkalibacillus almallahensis]
MNKVKSLLVIWKDFKTNLYYHVGTLNYDGNRYVFEYSFKSESPRNVYAALEQGYRLHPAFPELTKTYQSTSLFSTFNRRIPDENRIGYVNILEELSLNSNADRMDLLQATRGVLSGDPYSFEEPLRLNENTLTSNFYINGMRHNSALPENWPEHIHIGDSLTAKLEEDNEYDRFAVGIYHETGIFLGYVPGIYAQAIYALIKNNENISIIVKNTRPNYASQWWIQVTFKATIHLNNHDYDQFNDLIIENIA